jgi:hypothetical protein
MTFALRSQEQDNFPPPRSLKVFHYLTVLTTRIAIRLKKFGEAKAEKGERL